MGKLSTSDLKLLPDFKDTEEDDKSGDNESNKEDSKGNGVNTTHSKKSSKNGENEPIKKELKLIGTRLPKEIDDYLEFMVFSKGISKQDLLKKVVISGIAKELGTPDSEEDVLNKIHQELAVINKVLKK